MAELSNVNLSIEDDSDSHKKVVVSYDVQFSSEEVDQNKEFEISISLYGTDLKKYEEELEVKHGKSVDFEIYSSFGPPSLYDFIFYRKIPPLYIPGSPSKFKTIRADNKQGSYSDVALVESSLLDEDPGKLKIEYPGICASCPPIVIEFERVDEVYAIVNVRPVVEIASSRSNVARVPLRNYFGEPPNL